MAIPQSGEGLTGYARTARFVFVQEKKWDSLVRYFQVMPTFQLGPRCQLELGGAPPATLRGVWPGVPEPGRKGSRQICSVRHFQAGCECTARKEFTLHALRLCARVRDRRQTLMRGMCLIIANVLATSYCNLAKGRCPAKFSSKRPRPERPIKAKLADDFCRDWGEAR